MPKREVFVYAAPQKELGLKPGDKTATKAGITVNIVDTTEEINNGEVAIIGADPRMKLEPGSKPYPCSRCGDTVSLAPSSQVVLASNARAIVLCLACGIRDME